MVKKHLSDLSNKIDHDLQPVFSSRKLSDDLKVQEPKPPLINQQCVVYHFVCDLCEQITSAIPAVTFTNALMNIGSRPSGNT